MKYMLLTYVNPNAWEGWENPTQEFKETIAFMEKLNNELVASGEFVDASGLADPATAKTLRRKGGEAVATDGPYAETKEVLGGFWVLDCESYDRALAIAARVVGDAPGSHTIEVRPMQGE